MPKKAKKGGGKGKKGKKGGKKGKKGKKGAKGKKGSSKKDKKDNIAKLAIQNSQIWEARLDMTEKSRLEFRETAKRLADENASLDDLMRNTERDTIDVISFLKKQDQTKDDEIYKLNESIKEMKRQQRKEKEAIISDLSQQITQLENQLAQKTNDIQLLQNELKMVKEFRRKRGQMQKELDEIKESLYNTNRDHQTTLNRMEQKFFEEKLRMQQEANQKISELAERAHLEAIANLDETTRSVYKENVRVNEALRYHMDEGDRLKKKVATLHEENSTLKADKEMTDAMVREKITANKKLKEHVKKLEDKVEVLESSLSHSVQEFERDRDTLIDRGRTESESSRKEVVKLQRLLELRTREMARVRQLAKNILDQRSEIERFFLESLGQVKREIQTNQTQYLRDAKAAYQQRMLLAHAGKADYPPVRTFSKNDASTNNVFRDLAAAERLHDISGDVDISDLTWEQKERVLRHLFARMNGLSPMQGAGDLKRTAIPPIQSGNGTHVEMFQLDDGLVLSGDVEDFGDTFLTQAQPDKQISPPQETVTLPPIAEPIQSELAIATT